MGIKKFKEPDDDEIAKKTIMREVRMLRMLKYKNIVTLKEAFKRKGRLYLVFEYVEKNLLEVLEENSVGIDVSFTLKLGCFCLFYQLLFNFKINGLNSFNFDVQAKRLRFFAYQMIKGVTFCHRSNIIHRDIKPENLLINPYVHHSFFWI